MNIISRKALLTFVKKHTDAAEPLDIWRRRTRKAKWLNLADLKMDYPVSDLVGNCMVFNIGGNKYRLIVKIKYLKQTVYIRFVLTHQEYDKNKGGWKYDCGC